MTVIATDSQRFSNVVKYEQDPAVGITREQGVFNDTAQTLKVGTVLGKVTATGKWRVALSASSDGSQTPAGIYIADVLGQSADLAVANATDTQILVLARGDAIVADAALILGTGITLAAVRTAFLAINNPIIVETQV